MATRLAELEDGIERDVPANTTDVGSLGVLKAVMGQQDAHTRPCTAAPSLESAEYQLLYRPTMVGVYTARHQRMPESDGALREHVFGSGSQPGCEVCREETEFLVAHQMRFF